MNAKFVKFIKFSELTITSIILYFEGKCNQTWSPFLKSYLRCGPTPKRLLSAGFEKANYRTFLQPCGKLKVF